jgi:hypothetical protein
MRYRYQMSSPVDSPADQRPSPEHVDRVLRALGREQSAHDARLGQWLLQGFRLGVHRLHGYGSFREYAERVFGFTGRATEERLRTAEALEDLPSLATAFEEGAVAYSVVRELTRVATADTEAAWLEAAQGRTAREVERLVSGRTKGDSPTSPRRLAAERRRVTWNLSAEAYAMLREARRALTQRCGHGLDDDSLVAMLAEAVLSRGKERDTGRSAYQVALTVCESCRHGEQEAGGEPVAVDGATVAMAECDGQQVGRVDAASPERASQTIPPRVRRAVLRRHHDRCAVPGCAHGAFVHVHHIELRSEGGTHDPEWLVPLCSAHHRAVHDGRLVVSGTYSQGFAFTHADGSRYGVPHADAGRSKVLAEVFQILASMGFRQREARQMIDEAGTHVGAEMGVQEALRIVLRRARVSCVSERIEPYGEVGTSSGWWASGYGTPAPARAYG